MLLGEGRYGPSTWGDASAAAQQIKDILMKITHFQAFVAGAYVLRARFKHDQALSVDCALQKAWKQKLK